MSDHDTPNMPHLKNDGAEPDRLDALLAAWHAANAERARAGRDRLLAALAEAPAGGKTVDRPVPESAPRTHAPGRAAPVHRHWMRRFLMNRYSPVAAAFITLLVVGVMLLPPPSAAVAQQATAVMAPDGGRLDALDADGNVLGPCALKHTDVHAEVSGPLVRVTVKQTYANPFDDKIETVYTFPLSHRAAVDRMTMTIGSRVVVGEVKEREAARRIYEAARAAGRIASLLEQQRPNIFTQSVANIEPRAEIVIEISYVELLEPSNGVYSFEFPTVVGPRYIPGGGSGSGLNDGDAPASSPMPWPPGIRHRRGLVLTAPGKVTLLPESPSGTVSAKWLGGVLNSLATPVRPDASYQQPEVIATFRVDYPDGSGEFGSLRSDGVGEVGGRWFFVVLPRGGAGETSAAPSPGSPFSPPTDQVPDADKITPMPTRPPTRAGHDISISVDIDTGGPGLTSLASPSHDIRAKGAVGAARASTSLAKAGEIPNKDFVLTWSTAGSGIQEGVFTHTGEHGNFFSIILEPPARVEPDQIVARELCFVLDTSGSMSGWPIEKSKELMTKAISQMRPVDTFNVITFAGSTDVLWKSPRPASAENIGEAQAFVGSKQGRGGTEMMKAINAALEQAPVKRGGAPRPLRVVVFLTDAFIGNDMAVIDAIKKNRGTTRVFSLGVGNSVNRYLIDQMAAAGGGESEVVLLDQEADGAVARLTRRIQSPVLTDIAIDFSGNLSVTEVLPADEAGHLPDLYDLRPLVLTGRYTAPGSGTLTIRGNTGAGAFERSINVTLPPMSQGSDAIATLWARAKVDQVTGRDLKALQEGRFPEPLRSEVVTLGETFQIMTPFTSFVAVDKLSVTVNGKPRLVHIPIELPDGTAWEGFFGPEAQQWAAGDDFESGFRADVSAESLGARARASRSKLEAGDVKQEPTALRENRYTPRELRQIEPGSPAPAPSAKPAAPAAAEPAPTSAGVPVSAPSRGAAAGQPGSAGGRLGGGESKDAAEKGAYVVRRQLKLRDGIAEFDQPSAPEINLEGVLAARQAGGVINGGANSIPPVFGEIPVLGRAFVGGDQAAGAFVGGDEATEKRLVTLYAANPLTASQLRLLGISGDASARDQLASGRVPAAHLVRAAAGLGADATAMKSAAAALLAAAPEDVSVGELVAIAALVEAKDAGAPARAKALVEQAGAKLDALYRALKLAQTVEPELYAAFKKASADKGAASQELAVVVLVSTADRDTLDGVRAAGLSIDYAEVEQRIVIGRVAVDKLEGVALLEVVRRVERDR